MVGTLHPDATLADLTSRGFTQDQARQMIANMVDAQSMVVSMDHVFFIASLVLFLAAAVVWLAPRPTAKVDLSAAH